MPSNPPQPAISLGNRVRDTITSFTGIAVGRTVWLYGCARVGIEPTELREGKPLEIQWFDEQRVEVLEPSAPVVSPNSRATTGGPQADPSRGREGR